MDGTEQEPKERRRFPRHEADLPFVLIGEAGRALSEASGRASPEVSLQNLSRGGLGFQSPVALKEGDLIEFRLELPGASRVSGTARVQWCHLALTGHTYDCGAEFVRLGWGHSGRLRRFLDPDSGRWGRRMDMVLGLACCLVSLAVLVEANRNPLAAWLAARAIGGAPLWLPQVLAAAGALLGAAVFLRR